MSKEIRFIVVPKGSFTIASLGEFLNTFYQTDGAECHFVSGTVPKDGFFVPHGVITKIKSQYPDWKARFELFSQKGENEIRKYSIPSRKKTAVEKKAVTDLAEIVARKNKK